MYFRIRNSIEFSGTFGKDPALEGTKKSGTASVHTTWLGPKNKQKAIKKQPNKKPSKSSPSKSHQKAIKKPSKSQQKAFKKPSKSTPTEPSNRNRSLQPTNRPPPTRPPKPPSLEMSLHLIVGPMFSGKTTALMQAVEKYTLASIPVLTVSHLWDLQRTEHHEILHSHSHRKMPCHMLRRLSSLFDLPEYTTSQVVAIDEAQFFDDLVSSVLRLVERDSKIVFVAGLDGSFERKPLGFLASLLPFCDTIQKMAAVCKQCAPKLELAPFTQKTKNGTGPPNNQDAAEVCIGGSELYEAVCRKHFLEPSMVTAVASAAQNISRISTPASHDA